MYKMTPLDKSLKRALQINGRDYVITLSPDVLKITQKGHRLGLELKWTDLVSGESALAVALHASVGKFLKTLLCESVCAELDRLRAGRRDRR